jgi:predicted nucleic acid-binding Zn ribbon protein
MNRRAPRPIGVALAALGERLEPASTLAATQRHWDEVVGLTIATHARPVAERSGVLDVACGEAVWAAELELMGPELIDALNKKLGAGKLRSLRVRADAARSPRQTP